MRKTIMSAIMAVALGGAVGWVPSATMAGQAMAPPSASRSVIQPVQYYGEPRHYRGDWERRRHWRAHRRAREEARIAEAARREAYRIEQERAHRRAWRRAQRQQYGHYYGY